jgi:hypothetical protein
MAANATNWHRANRRRLTAQQPHWLMVAASPPLRCAIIRSGQALQETSRISAMELGTFARLPASRVVASPPGFGSKMLLRVSRQNSGGSIIFDWAEKGLIVTLRLNPDCLLP